MESVCLRLLGICFPPGYRPASTCLGRGLSAPLRVDLSQRLRCGQAAALAPSALRWDNPEHVLRAGPQGYRGGRAQWYPHRPSIPFSPPHSLAGVSRNLLPNKLLALESCVSLQETPTKTKPSSRYDLEQLQGRPCGSARLPGMTSPPSHLVPWRPVSVDRSYCVFGTQPHQAHSLIESSHTLPEAARD